MAKIILIILENLFVVIGAVAFIYDKDAITIWCLMMAIVCLLNQIIIKMREDNS